MGLGIGLFMFAMDVTAAPDPAEEERVRPFLPVAQFLGGGLAAAVLINFLIIGHKVHYSYSAERDAIQSEELVQRAAILGAELHRAGQPSPERSAYVLLNRFIHYEADNLVCAGDLPEGRPTPMNMYQCFLDLGVWPAHAVVKVDDTGVGIDEGVRAGCWTIGVALSGNEAGLTVDEVRRADPAALQTVRRRATGALKAHGAHYVIDTVADLMPVIDDIERKLAQGLRP